MKLGRRVLLFPLPWQGHLNPMFELAQILYSKGFSITIIHTNFNSPNPSNFPHFTFRSLSTCYTVKGVQEDDCMATIAQLNINLVEEFSKCLAHLISESDETKEPISCLIADSLWHFTQATLEHFKLPRILLRPSSPCCFPSFANISCLFQKGYTAMQDSQLEEPVSEFPPLRVKDIPFVSTRNPDDLFETVRGMVRGLRGSSGVIWNTFDELDQDSLEVIKQEINVPMFPIGPFYKHFPTSSSSLLAQDQSCISWLDTQAPKSVIYVSFGSIVKITEGQFLEIAKGLAKSKQPFLWVVRPGSIHGSQWLEPMPIGFMEALDGRGYIVKWAPQREVLAHPAIGCFWTHGGWNSTLESICEGVPMICLPGFGDQKVNARFVADVWKIGLYMEKGCERGKIDEAIQRIMVDEEGEELKKRIMDFKERANLSLKPGGSSYNSLNNLINHMLSL